MWPRTTTLVKPCKSACQKRFSPLKNYEKLKWSLSASRGSLNALKHALNVFSGPYTPRYQSTPRRRRDLSEISNTFARRAVKYFSLFSEKPQNPEIPSGRLPLKSGREWPGVGGQSDGGVSEIPAESRSQLTSRGTRP